MKDKGVPYFKAWLKTDKKVVEVLYINYIDKTIGYKEEGMEQGLKTVGFYDTVLIEEEKRV